MKKVLFGTAVALALLTGCTEEKKAPVTQTEATQEVKKEETSATPVVQDEVKAEETKVEETTPATEEAKAEETK